MVEELTSKNGSKAMVWRSLRAFKRYYEICGYRERLMEPLRKKWKGAKKDKIRILHCKHQY